MENPALWDNPENAQKVSKEKKRLDDTVGLFKTLTNGVNDAAELFELSMAEGDYASVEVVGEEVFELEKSVEKLEFQRMFNQPMDGANCYDEDKVERVTRLLDLYKQYSDTIVMLIENDKRGPKNKLQLLYSRELFHVPGNVYLIGMMNTADRSLAMLDYALRRRFAFFDLKPGFDSDGFVAYRDGLGSAKLDELLACVVRLNEAIAGDETLGDGFCIGHDRIYKLIDIFCIITHIFVCCTLLPFCINCYH